MYQLFYLYLLPATIAGSVAFFVVMLCNRVVGKLHWRTQRVWQILNFLFFCIPIGGILRTVWKLPRFKSGTVLQYATDTAKQTTHAVLIPPQTVPSSGVSVQSTPDLQSLLAIFPWIWLVGVVLTVGIQWYRYLRFCKELKKLSVPADRRIQSMICGIWSENGAHRCPESYLCEGLNTALLVGMLRPKLYLPANWAPCEYALALRHEVQHVVQGDMLLKLVTSIVCAIHWFNPLCRRFSVRISSVCELACDEKATLSMTKPQKKAYAQLLLQTARKGMPTIVSGFGGSGLNLKWRLEALFSEKNISTKKESQQRWLQQQEFCFLPVHLSACRLRARESTQNLTAFWCSRIRKVSLWRLHSRRMI